MLKKWFRNAKSRYFYERLARSRSVRNLVLRTEGAVKIDGASGLLYEGGDHSILVHPHDKTIGASIRREGAYQRKELLAAINAARGERGVSWSDKRVFVDIGANIGTHSIYALKSGAFDRVVAIEPEMSNLLLLRKNFAINAMSESALVVPCGASDSEGRAELWLNPDNLGAHSIIRPKYGERHVSIILKRVDDILRDVAVDYASVGLVSIDVEGHEPAAIRGMPSLLRCKPPLMIELNPDALGFLEMFEQLREIYENCLVLSGPDLQPLTKSEGVRSLQHFPTPTEKFDLLFL